MHDTQHVGARAAANLPGRKSTGALPRGDLPVIASIDNKNLDALLFPHCPRLIAPGRVRGRALRHAP